MALELSEDLLLSSAKRFMVLVPDFGIDEVAFGRTIWDLALPNLSDIVYLSAVRNLDEERCALHRLAVLYGVSQDARIRVDVILEFGLSWDQAIKQNWRQGDVLVCCSGHSVRFQVFRRVSIQRLLEMKLNLPAVILSTSFSRVDTRSSLARSVC